MSEQKRDKRKGSMKGLTCRLLTIRNSQEPFKEYDEVAAFLQQSFYKMYNARDSRLPEVEEAGTDWWNRQGASGNPAPPAASSINFDQVVAVAEIDERLAFWEISWDDFISVVADLNRVGGPKQALAVREQILRLREILGK